MIKPDRSYWEGRYLDATAVWDIGYVSPPLKEYFDQLTDKQVKILIPGGGNGYEAEYLFQNNFSSVFPLDIAEMPLKNFALRVPGFPEDHLLQDDFFHHQGQYDLIIEQTFFCALHPSLRSDYARKMNELLKPGGKLVGVLFDDPMISNEAPPFGGTKNEYLKYFSPLFDMKIFERATNSIKPRQGRELFMVLIKK